MKVVVADTSPLNYLVLIGCIDLLPSLYSRIVVPVQVFDELIASGAPDAVASWARNYPNWLEIRQVGVTRLPALEEELDAGESAAIRLAFSEPDCLLLIDESEGRAVAARLGLNTTGTLGILLAAASEGLTDLRVALEKLRHTNFRISRSLMDSLLGAADRRRRPVH